MRSFLLSTAFVLTTATASFAEDARTAHRATLNSTDIGGHSVSYLDLGDPAVMLLHGIPTSSYLFRDVAPEITAAGYRVIAPDLLGFGASDRTDDMAAYRRIGLPHPNCLLWQLLLSQPPQRVVD